MKRLRILLVGTPLRRFLFSAKGAFSCQPGAAPQGFRLDNEQALKARFNAPVRRQSTQVGVANEVGVSIRFATPPPEPDWRISRIRLSRRWTDSVLTNV